MNKHVLWKSSSNIPFENNENHSSICSDFQKFEYVLMIVGGTDFLYHLISSFLCIYCYFKKIYAHMCAYLLYYSKSVLALHIILFFPLNNSYFILNIIRKFFEDKAVFLLLSKGDTLHNFLKSCYAHRRKCV